MTDAPTVHTILFVVGDREPLRLGLAWRIWASGGSFYVKTREPGLAMSKVSLHGPDEWHAEPGFKFGNDTSVQEDLSAAVNTGDPLPWWFSGKVEGNNLTHAIRICVPADTFADGAPTGNDTGKVRNRTFAGLLQVPPVGASAMLDLFVSDGPPRIPIREKLERLNALHGPIMNTAGQYLAGVTRILTNDRLEFPRNDTLVPRPENAADAVRGVHASVADDGVLWLIEGIFSRAWLSAGSTQGLASGSSVPATRASDTLER